MIKLGKIRCYTLNEIAEAFDVHTATIRRYIHKDKLKARKVGRRYLISEKSLDKFLQAQDVKDKKGSFDLPNFI
jgi:excisionase family DNA binding protein